MGFYKNDNPKKYHMGSLNLSTLYHKILQEPRRIKGHPPFLPEILAMLIVAQKGKIYELYFEGVIIKKEREKQTSSS